MKSRAFFLERTGTLLLAIVLLGVIGNGPGEAAAQTSEEPSEEASAWWSGTYRTGISSSHVPAGEAFEHRVHVSRLIPLSLPGPEGALQSRAEIGPVELGVRTEPGGRYRWRVRAALVRAQLFRAPLAAGLTLAEYRRSGLLAEEHRWIDVRLGGSIRWSRGPWAVEPRAVGSAGLSTIRPGPSGWDLGEASDARRTGFDGGVYAELPLRLEGRGYVSVRAGLRHGPGSPAFTGPWAEAELTVTLPGGLHWSTDARWVSLGTGSARDDRLILETGLHRTWN